MGITSGDDEWLVALQVSRHKTMHEEAVFIPDEHDVPQLSSLCGAWTDGNDVA